MLTTFLVFSDIKLYDGIPDFRFHLPLVTAVWPVSVRGHGTHQKVNSGLSFMFLPCFRLLACVLFRYIFVVHIFFSSQSIRPFRPLISFPRIERTKLEVLYDRHE